MPARAKPALVPDTFVQGFGGSLNLHVHFHVLFLKGLFACEPERLPIFHQALTPTRNRVAISVADDDLVAMREGR